MTKIDQALIREYKSSIQILSRVESPATLYREIRGFSGGFQSFYTVLFAKVCGVFDYIQTQVSGNQDKKRGFSRAQAGIRRHLEWASEDHWENARSHFTHVPWRLRAKRYVMCELKSIHFMLVNRPSSKLGVQFINVMMSSRIRKRFALCMVQSRLISDFIER